MTPDPPQPVALCHECGEPLYAGEDVDLCTDCLLAEALLAGELDDWEAKP